MSLLAHTVSEHFAENHQNWLVGLQNLPDIITIRKRNRPYNTVISINQYTQKIQYFDRSGMWVCENYQLTTVLNQLTFIISQKE